MNYADIIKNLREALTYSPNNVVLRKQLADMLYGQMLYEEAEQEYKATLNYDPHNESVKLGLAQTFYALKKYDAALVVTEELLSLGNNEAALLMLYARLLFEKQSYKEAYDHYKVAISSNGHLQDKEFEEKLNKAISTSGQAVSVSVPSEETEKDFIERDMERPTVTFKEVGGMDKVKEEISLKVIYPMQNPQIYQAYGKKIGGGILMYGPPGCGKTLLARATAGEIKAGFISVGINDVLDMWVGNSEKNLHQIFQQARRKAPCVLFFDEVDALGASRSDMRRSEGRFLINQFLNELDGVEYSNEGVLVLAATNSPWYLDAAFRRPGRFDRLIFVQPPDKAARLGILQILLREVPTENLDLEPIAKATEDFSGADLKAVVDLAVEAKITESFKTGRPMPLTTQDLKAATSRHVPTTREWFSAAKNYALYANESGLYDDILKYLKIKK
ncbi:AAA family ATPase [Xanthocytophaga agilis]|uniref:AAA family ATPase n=1 Tax=Xanthocytophaga agilis TaxID=3048010 RepID=A0AAE3UJC1_9BACT|nr:AAA family ATPase [Xanthocytophaga agilis]MDJ1504933.1 AAA family ATPase [Xanthocytophaga agilis]